MRRYINKVHSSTHLQVDGTSVSSRYSDISPMLLSKKWNVGFKTAEATLRATTQKYVRSGSMSLVRRFKQFHPRDQVGIFVVDARGMYVSKV